MSIAIQSKAFPNEARNPTFYQPFKPQIPVTEKTENLKWINDESQWINDDLTEEEDPPLESDWHVAAMALLVHILRDFWTDRDDIYVSGNTVVRYDPNQQKRFRGPDLYVIKGVTDKSFRRSWASWEESCRWSSPHRNRLRYERTLRCWLPTSVLRQQQRWLRVETTRPAFPRRGHRRLVSGNGP